MTRTSVTLNKEKGHERKGQTAVVNNKGSWMHGRPKMYSYRETALLGSSKNICCLQACLATILLPFSTAWLVRSPKAFVNVRRVLPLDVSIQLEHKVPNQCTNPSPCPLRVAVTEVLREWANQNSTHSKHGRLTTTVYKEIAHHWSICSKHIQLEIVPFCFPRAWGFHACHHRELICSAIKAV